MFFLNTQSKEPIFEQIQNQILRFIQAGVLAPGDRLPSVRQLAQENGINPNTVSKAYIELEKNGYVYNIPKTEFMFGGETWLNLRNKKNINRTNRCRSN